MYIYIHEDVYIYIPVYMVALYSNQNTKQLRNQPQHSIIYIYSLYLYTYLYIYMIKPIGKNPPTNPQTLLSLANPDPYTETLKPAPALCD